MVLKLKPILKKSYFDLRERLPLFVVLSFMVLVSLSIILISNEVFINNTIEAGNTIYSELVRVSESGGTAIFGDSIYDIVVSFLIWFAWLLVTLIVTVPIILFGLKSKTKFTKKFLLYSIIISLALGILLSLFLNGFVVELILVLSMIFFSIACLFVIFKKESKLYKSIFKGAYKKIILYQLLYFVLTLLLFIIKVFFVKGSAYNSTRSVFEFLDVLIIALVLHVALNSLTSINKKRSSFKETFVYSMTNKVPWKLTGFVAAFFVVLSLVLPLLAKIPYTEYLILLLMYLILSFGSIYYTKFSMEVHKKVK